MSSYKKFTSLLVLASAAGLGMAAQAFAADPVDPNQMIAAMEKAFGVTPGQRRNHTKGTCASGEFVGLKAGAQYSRSALFSGTTIPVVARFSLGGGNPHASDSDKGGRGMALEFKLGKELQHMTMLNVPVFGASVPGTFYDLLVALAPDEKTGKPDPEKMKLFRESHPDFHGMSSFIGSHNPPANYANAPYYSLHAFKFVDKTDKQTLVRWEFQPQDGMRPLTDAEMNKGETDFLENALIERTQAGPVKWDMFITLGQAGDSEVDASKPWPEDRLKVQVGTLALTSASNQTNGSCEPINFDPLVLADGIMATPDPVLRARSAAYAISFGKRLSGL
ncbi:catalase family peroxidase [Shewanella salipaludis]|uniref:Catalase-related peroxidase n=1 Tax=Shewanella salipaludis TaxID=2723052 RepID=A0A972FR69_9GAMM|nr:catalase family peroxidase [Shewanella salipaludis]NMH64256.1 catalase family peroxidase [Shewanella salipaludis]